jgi:hypothetical protein
MRQTTAKVTTFQRKVVIAFRAERISLPFQIVYRYPVQSFDKIQQFESSLYAARKLQPGLPIDQSATLSAPAVPLRISHVAGTKRSATKLL